MFKSNHTNTNDSIGTYILHKYKKCILTRNIYSDYDKFNYESADLFKIDVNHILSAYDLQLTEITSERSKDHSSVITSNTSEQSKDHSAVRAENKNVRSEQDKFRHNIINRDKCCVISKTDYDDCEAAHIVPFAESNNYDIDNGLLLDKTLHSSFDKHYWCIDPTTLRIVLNETKTQGKNLSCVKYQDLLINIKPNEKMLKYLQERYCIFCTNK
jgi:predicted restriction endonuclease